jgi:hypothetical protein
MGTVTAVSLVHTVFERANGLLVSNGLMDQAIDLPSLANERATVAVLLWGLEPVALLSWV